MYVGVVFGYLPKLIIIALVTGYGSLVLAQSQAESAGEVREVTEEESSNYLNLRVGGATGGGNGRPVLCGEVTVWAGASVEACGTGSGILHSENESEMAHFRAKLRVKRWRLRESNLELRIAGGFAELQVGADKPGFSFGRPSDSNSVETAGPEAGTSLRWNLPWTHGFEFLIDVSIGAAWFEHAPALIAPSPRFQSFGEFTFGIGY